jgi:hypothetical protein
MNNKTGKCLTYEEIGSIMDISPQQVHKIEREAFNKLVKGLSMYPGVDIFESVMEISKYLGIDTDIAYKKLDDSNLEKLNKYIFEKYGKKVNGYEPKSTDSIEDMFQ